MAKDPAFLFYPGDWNLGTMHLTLLEKGCYIELLVLQFAKGQFTEAQAKHMLNGSFDLAWPTLREKFKTDGTFFWNERLKLEKEKRQKFTDSRKSNGSVKKEEKHMPKHMEATNENISISIRGEVFFNAEEQVLKNIPWFESMCMKYSKTGEDGKDSLRKYHLYLEEKEQYPKPKKAIFAGFEKWLMNERNYPQQTNKQVSDKKKMVL